MKGAIVIITHNNIRLTKTAVNSALHQDVPCNVLVIDNASTDGTVPWLRSKAGICIVPYSTPQSLAACWNKAIRAFWDIGLEEVLVCNNDIQLRRDTYRMLLEQVKMGRKFVTCVSVDSEERMGQPGDRNEIVLYENARPHPDYSCFMITKAVTDAGCWFDESYYPAYYEDNDHHVRMHRAGIQAVCVDLPFLHYGAQTVKTAGAGELARIQRYADQNKKRFHRKYGCYPGTPEYAKLFEV